MAGETPNVPSETAWNAEEIRAAAKSIGNIMGDMGTFQSLKEHWPNAGQFETAQWLERIVDDRRNGVVAHAERMKTICEEMETQLTKIADEFENTDGDNAKAVQQAVGDMKTNIDSAVDQSRTGTEAEQHNFSDDPDIDSDTNSSDGDGYNDVLPT
ncbi:hypothetical protein [Saccharopolyspora sp. NPDC002686]|uniref:hypothetical protein n=1 Tax=Saccharopolyspora sp. NPDC002686 TaxID=3154541 RepID=UPI003318F04A